MTLIAFAVRPDEVDVVTDSMSYTDAQCEIGFCSKIKTLPHVDGAYMTNGSHTMGVLAGMTLAEREFEQTGIDDWPEMFEERLADLWRATEEARSGAGCDEGGYTSNLYVVGWSPAHERFVAWEFCSDSDFKGRDLTDHEGIFSNPAVSDLDLAPTDDEAWVAWLRGCVDQVTHPRRRLYRRAVMIAGDFTRTHIRRGQIQQRRIHTLGPDDWEFRRMMIGSYHRFGQLGPCLCGSGQPAVICHLEYMADLDAPCPCGGGSDRKAFGECHKLDARNELQYVLEHIDDYGREREVLAAVWREVVPNDPTPAPSSDIIEQLRGVLSAGQLPR